ncbi:unnamed protein product, partial [Urochloa humidicola]
SPSRRRTFLSQLPTTSAFPFRRRGLPLFLVGSNTTRQQKKTEEGEGEEGGEEKRSANAAASTPRREHHDADEPEVAVQEPRQDIVDDLAEPEHEEDEAAVAAAEVDVKMGTTTPSHADGAPPPPCPSEPRAHRPLPCRGTCRQVGAAPSHHGLAVSLPQPDRRRARSL